MGLRKFLRLKPRDWKIVWYERGSWTISYIEILGNNDRPETSYCHYAIYYSESRNRYKLKVRGYRPKENTIYITAMKTLIDFQNSSNR